MANNWRFGWPTVQAEPFTNGMPWAVENVMSSRPRAIVRHSHVNAMAADTSGNIFYVYNGAIPSARPSLIEQTRRRLRPDTDWQGYHSFEDLVPNGESVVDSSRIAIRTADDHAAWQGAEARSNGRNPKTAPPNTSLATRNRDNGRARSSRRILMTRKIQPDDLAVAAFTEASRPTNACRNWSGTEPGRQTRASRQIERTS